VVFSVELSDYLSARHNRSEIDRNRPYTSRDLHTYRCLIVSGERAVGGYSFTERCFDYGRSFNLPSWSRLGLTVLSLSLRGLIVTLARGQKKRPEQERHYY